MTIVLFGTGCDLCREIAVQIESLIPLLDEDIQFEKSMDLERMLQMGVKSTPSLVINGKVIVMRGSLTMDEIRDLCKHS